MRTMSKSITVAMKNILILVLDKLLTDFLLIDNILSWWFFFVCVFCLNHNRQPYHEHFIQRMKKWNNKKPILSGSIQVHAQNIYKEKKKKNKIQLLISNSKSCSIYLFVLMFETAPTIVINIIQNDVITQLSRNHRIQN